MSFNIRSLRREPLVWFLIAGLSLFGLHALVRPGSDVAASRVIEVDRETLLRFMQQRARSFDEKAAAKLLEKMPPREVTAMVDDMVREEAMYREGLQLGLDKNDYVLRRRLIQSLEYMADSAAGEERVDEAALGRYYETHRSRYVASPSISFSHVFFSAGAHGWEGAQRMANNALPMLNMDKEPASLSADRFLYLRDYADRSPDMIEGHFGEGFTRQLFGLAANETRWQGPLRSTYGYHLVRIATKDVGRPLPFAEARAMVTGDMAKDATDGRREAFARDLLAQFNVDIGRDVRKLMAR